MYLYFCISCISCDFAFLYFLYFLLQSAASSHRKMPFCKKSLIFIGSDASLLPEQIVFFAAKIGMRWEHNIIFIRYMEN